MDLDWTVILGHSGRAALPLKNINTATNQIFQHFFSLNKVYRSSLVKTLTSLWWNREVFILQQKEKALS